MSLVVVAVALLAVVMELGRGTPPGTPTMATAPLSLSSTTAYSLSGASLEDLSWISASDGWALGAQPCAKGICARLAHTSDGGSWKMAGALPKAQELALLAAPSRGTFVVSTGATGGVGAFTTRLLVSTDEGAHWTAVAADTQQLIEEGTPAWLGFEASQIGRWISSPHDVWTTVDGGLHWSRTASG